MNTPSSRHPFESEQTLVDDEHPWPGLASFREQDEHFFKGREPDIKSLHNLVTRERLTILFGVSGLGKSSLLQAGLFPRLRQDTMLPIFIRLDFSDAAAGLIEQVFAAIARQVQEKAIEAPDHRESETLWEYFHRKDAEFWDARNRLVIPVLCFDQLEEVFTLGREAQKRGPELKQLLSELADLVEGRCPESVKARLDANAVDSSSAKPSPEGVHVLKSTALRLDSNPNEAQDFSFSRHPYKLIFSLREDYLADLEGLRGLMPSIIHNRMRLRHMNGEQALAVADQTQGRLMEPSVAETIVRLVAGEQVNQSRELATLRIEPALLSLVCRELNERRIATKAGQIDAQTVATNREQILENFYERSLAGQAPELRWFIEDKLITLSGFRNSEAHENALGTPGITAEALDQLVQCRLLRLEERDGVKRIELIHDVLTGVVRKNRDQRLVLKKQRQAEQERREAEQREQAARAALRRSKRWALTFLILTGIAVLSAAWGWWSWWDAKESRNKAQHALAVVDFRDAQQHYQLNNIPYALAHLAHAIRTDPEWVSSRTLLVNLLQQWRWILPVATFNNITDIHFSPDGTRLVTASHNKTARLWDAKTGMLMGTAMTHQDEVNSSQFSPDGTRVVTSSSDKTARLWNTKTGVPLGNVMVHQDKVQSAQFSPDSTWVVTTSNNVRMWDGKTGQPIGEPMAGVDSNPQFSSDGKSLSNLQLSPDGKSLVTSSYFSGAKLWDAKTGMPIGEATPARVLSVQFSPDSTRLLIGFGNIFSNTDFDVGYGVAEGSAQLWDIKTGQPLGETMMHQASVTAKFSPDGGRVVTASIDKTARLWDANTGKPLGEVMTHQGSVSSAEFSPDGTRVVTASSDKTARLWDANTGKPLGEVMTHQGSVNSAEFSFDGTRTVTASDDKTMRIWDANSGMPLGATITHQEKFSTKFSLDGTRVLTTSFNDGARLWNVQSGKLQSYPILHQSVILFVQFSPDGTQLMTISAGEAVQLWDSRSGKPLGVTMTHHDRIHSAELSPDGARVVTVSEDKTARLWDAQTGKALGEPMTHQAEVRSAQFSPDGMRMLTVSGNTSQLWDAQTGQPLGEAMTHQAEVRSAQFSPDGTRVVTASDDKTVRLWDSQTGQPLGEAMMHQYFVNSAQFSPDGTQVLTEEYTTARLWDVKTGKPLGKVMTHQESVSSAQYSPDGMRILTVSGNTTQLWDGKTGQPLGKRMTNQQHIKSIQHSPDGMRILTVSGNTTQQWDAKTGQPLGEAMTHQYEVWSAQYSSDGAGVLTLSSDKIARLWDAKTGKPLGEAIRHQREGWQGDVWAAQFSPDGTRVVTTGNKSIRLWDAKTGKPLSEAMANQDSVRLAQFSPDGTRVVTVEEDNIVRLWDLSPVTSDNNHLLAALAEAVTGNKLSDLGAVEALDDSIERLNELRRQTANAPLGEPTAESFTRWFLSDPWTRTVSPLSSLAVPDYIRQQIAAGRRDQMEQEFPGHPLLRPAPASKPGESSMH